MEEIEKLRAERKLLRKLLDEAVDMLPTHDGFGQERCDLARKIKKALERQ